MEERDQPITDDHRKLVFSFIRMMRRSQVENPERAEAVAQMLGEEFGVDPAGSGGLHDTEVDVLEAFKTALREHERRSGAEQDEKFVSFVELLEKKGYFKGVEKGSDEYAQRLEKAREKFNQRNNPYEGLTAEQIKNKGNELMSQAKYKEAIAYYTKAIELQPDNAVFFANRAAAHTHLKDYNNAIIDCERAIIINPEYSKSYSRLGTALFYQENYSRAVDAFTKACELDPDNATHKEDLKRAEEKAKGTALSTGGGLGGFPGMGGFPEMGGMPDMSQFANMMSNPQFMETAQRMMQNPEFSNLVANMASKFSQGGMNPAELNRLGADMGMRNVDEEGNVVTPFGKVNRAAIEQLQEEEVRKNPKLAGIMADVQANGYGAFQKYLGDPDVMNLMMKFQNLMFTNPNRSP
ncbi:putative small glutamine-rich tetratricopeptide repeat protein [Leishmania major strain Friedlin]|uniref:Putative small glutamine-rich tetratricopeptide repeat protein n=1 Tax=Leishmania major TaxID=5664 RepID=Q4Q720_LEIMA|nr:putative small glutamine-rich tetratricopeptide repeat protein [Leishmania major strain Friedlin]CAG9578509.1 small_glutamine-rich_tetratricopeptide_repeat_protein_-_putative [Leishmania major strain Friedlin]CAJ06608.1 putative small glutamine-rich tetratricopeptide repeat protein [Leishmania major strain Friedlin]|eukprot:XP_001684878.1 putative small glutamine-rich tetratricopeptide repeat protein [Leishmania major strain Friedlin]